MKKLIFILFFLPVFAYGQRINYTQDLDTAKAAQHILWSIDTTTYGPEWHSIPFIEALVDSLGIDTSSTNIYTADGTIQAQRTITLNSNRVIFDGTLGDFEIDGTGGGIEVEGDSPDIHWDGTSASWVLGVSNTTGQKGEFIISDNTLFQTNEVISIDTSYRVAFQKFNSISDTVASTTGRYVAMFDTSGVTNPGEIVMIHPDSIGTSIYQDSGTLPGDITITANLNDLLFAGNQDTIHFTGSGKILIADSTITPLGDIVIYNNDASTPRILMQNINTGAGASDGLDIQMQNTGDVLMRNHETDGDFTVYPGSSGTLKFQTDSINFGLGATVQILKGNGNPNNVVTANQGSIFLRLDGGTDSTLHVKEFGSGNTGWVAL